MNDIPFPSPYTAAQRAKNEQVNISLGDRPQEILKEKSQSIGFLQQQLLAMANERMIAKVKQIYKKLFTQLVLVIVILGQFRIISFPFELPPAKGFADFQQTIQFGSVQELVVTRQSNDPEL